MVAVLLFVLLQLLVVLTTDGGHISDQSLFCRRTPRPNNLTTSNLQPDQNRREHRGDCPKLTAPAGCTEKGVPESILLHRRSIELRLTPNTLNPKSYSIAPKLFAGLKPTASLSTSALGVRQLASAREAKQGCRVLGLKGSGFKG